MDKAELRAHYKQLRASLGSEIRSEVDAAITQQVLGLAEFEAADTLFPYLSFGAEVDTRALIQAAWDAGKRVALPRCVPHTRLMKWYVVSSFDGLEKSSLGVEEPPANPAVETILDESGQVLVLVPGLTFDAKGYRLGYGGGFYDTLLASCGHATTSVGLCREVQLCESIDAREIHDVAVDMVVTEKQIMRIRQ